MLPVMGLLALTSEWSDTVRHNLYRRHIHWVYLLVDWLSRFALLLYKLGDWYQARHRLPFCP